jgi:hypothetical protein
MLKMQLAGLRADNTPSASFHTVLSSRFLLGRSISQKADVFDGGELSPTLFGALRARRKATSGGCGDEGRDCGWVVAHRDVPTARQRHQMSPGREFV